MKKINLGLMAVILVGMSSCAGAKLGSPEMRQKAYIIETKHKKTKNYNKSLIYLSKSIGDSNSAIKAKDKDEGMVVMKGLVVCDVLKQLGAPSMNLEFSLTINSKDKKVRMLFEDLRMTGNGSQWDYATLNTKVKTDKALTCLSPVVEGLKKALNKSSDNNW